MRKIDYSQKDAYTGNTENHIAVDTQMNENRYDAQRMEEGFAASDGVRPSTAETGGRRKHPESHDASYPDRVPASIKSENPGLADN